MSLFKTLSKFAETVSDELSDWSKRQHEINEKKKRAVPYWPREWLANREERLAESDAILNEFKHFILNPNMTIELYTSEYRRVIENLINDHEKEGYGSQKATEYLAKADNYLGYVHKERTYFEVKDW